MRCASRRSPRCFLSDAGLTNGPSSSVQAWLLQDPAVPVSQHPARTLPRQPPHQRPTPTTATTALPHRRPTPPMTAPPRRPTIRVTHAEGCGPIPGSRETGGGARAVPRPFRDDEAELDVDGQSGDGHTVVVAEVQLSRKAGFVAVCSPGDLLLGSLPIARSNDERSVTVRLDEPITRTTQLLVVLYADNGDGHFDWQTDPRVSGDDDDITDLEVERPTYRYAE